MSPQIRHPHLLDVTDDDFHIYVNGSTGDDGNTGLTIGSPKETLQAAFDMIPYACAHNVTVNMEGTFDEQGLAVLDKWVAKDKMILIDGGAARTSIAGPFVMDAANTVDAFGDAGAGFVADAHIGRLAYVTIAGQDPEIRMIYANSTTTITPVKDLSQVPAITDGFIVYRPTTIWQGTADDAGIVIRTRGHGAVIVQRLSLLGTKAYLSVNGSETAFGLAQVVNESTRTPSYDFFQSFVSSLGVTVVPTTWVATTDDVFAGFSQIGATGRVYMSGRKSMLGNVYGSVFTDVVLENGSAFGAIRYGSRIKGATVLKDFCGAAASITANEMLIDDAASGYATTMLDSSPGDNLLLTDSVAYIGAIDISSATGWGIRCVHSRLVHTGVTASSTGNGTGGCYADQGSVVLITSGSTPTYTNAANDLELSVDGSTEATDWGTIATPTPFASAAEVTIAKQI